MAHRLPCEHEIAARQPGLKVPGAAELVVMGPNRPCLLCAREAGRKLGEKYLGPPEIRQVYRERKPIIDQQRIPKTDRDSALVVMNGTYLVKGNLHDLRKRGMLFDIELLGKCTQLRAAFDEAQRAMDKLYQESVKVFDALDQKK